MTEFQRKVIDAAARLALVCHDLLDRIEALEQAIKPATPPDPAIKPVPAPNPTPPPVRGAVWSEGVFGDGAAILRDGEMVPIHEVVRELNRGAATAHELLQAYQAGRRDEAEVGAGASADLMEARTPKPPTLREQALELLLELKIIQSELLFYETTCAAIGADEIGRVFLPDEALNVLREDQAARRAALAQSYSASDLIELANLIAERNRARANAAAPPITYEWSITVDGDEVAGGGGPDLQEVERDAAHYLLQFDWDGLAVLQIRAVQIIKEITP